jgi:hypothetical protein
MNTKLIIAFVAVGVLAVALIGAVSAQLATTQSPAESTNNAQDIGFWGWIRGCLGFSDEQYYGQAPAYRAPLQANITVTDPNTGQTSTYQGYYGYGYGYGNGYRYGGCMRGFYP